MRPHKLNNTVDTYSDYGSSSNGIKKTKDFDLLPNNDLKMVYSPFCACAELFTFFERLFMNIIIL
jgi:hypothetical protein